MKRKIILIICSILFILDVVLVLTGNIRIFDNFIYDFLISFKSNNLTNIFIFFTNLSSSKFIIILNAIILLYILITKKTKLLIISINSLASTIVNNLLKFIIKRPRPIDIALVTEKFYSFPSGHAMISVLFYGTIMYLLYKNKVKYRNILTVIICSYILTVGISRIYLGVHYASDVIGGYLISIILLTSITYMYEKYFKE